MQDSCPRVAKKLDIVLSRPSCQNPYGITFIERMCRPPKEEAIWPNEFDTCDQALEAFLA